MITSFASVDDKQKAILVKPIEYCCIPSQTVTVKLAFTDFSWTKLQLCSLGWIILKSTFGGMFTFFREDL